MLAEGTFYGVRLRNLRCWFALTMLITLDPIYSFQFRDFWLIYAKVLEQDRNLRLPNAGWATKIKDGPYIHKNR